MFSTKKTLAVNKNGGFLDEARDFLVSVDKFPPCYIGTLLIQFDLFILVLLFTTNTFFRFLRINKVFNGSTVHILGLNKNFLKI